MNKIIPTLLVSCLAALPVFAEMVHITADRDNTLIENPDGALSSGMGPNFRAGRTNQSMFSVRRGLLRFDVASAVPADAIIDRVFLTLYKNPKTRYRPMSACTACWPTGARAIPSAVAAAVRRPNPATRHGCTRSTNTISGFTRAASSCQIQRNRDHRLAARIITPGRARTRWSTMCATGCTIRRATSAGWSWATSPRATAKRFDSREGANMNQHPM